MAITPNTDLFLLKCPLELDEANQVNFATATAQYNYFSSLPKLEGDNFTYQRKDSIIRFPAHIDTLLEYTYVMYRNTNYGSKWFYAYITDMQYINDNMTAISIKTDSWQTWCFNITLKKSFVEREHVADDTFGTNTVPEGLDTGDYVCNGAPTDYAISKSNDNNLAPVVLFQVTKATLTKDGNTYSYPSSTLGVYNGIPQGCICFGVRAVAANIGQLHAICGTYDAFGAGDAIVAISLVPYLGASYWSSDRDTGGNEIMFPTDSWGAQMSLEQTLARNTKLDGYTPKNNKMFTGEFNYAYLTNNAGGDITYKWENFVNGEIKYKVASAIDQGGSVKLLPTNSKVSSGATPPTDGWTEGLQGGKLPVLSWVSDYYLNWKAVNGKNMEIQANLVGARFASGLLNGQGWNITGMASEVAGLMQKQREAELTPAQAKGNVSTGDLNYSADEVKFTWRKMSVRSEYAQRIDEYLTAYGYRVNAFKLPQYTSRASWNYLKTKGINIEGKIPQADLQNIKNIFNTGVTMWHNPAYFLDYTQTNNIV